MSSEEQIARLTRERDLARTLAVEAMRTMTNGQLVELRCAMDNSEVDNHQLDAILEACGSISTDQGGMPDAASD